MAKPFIQIDDEIREMTDDEHVIYLERLQNETTTTDPSHTDV
jgi:hypothetical protein